MLRQSLDLGEASVIQLASDLDVPLVAIDETAGRRVARLSGLQVTGSIGILIKAKRTGYAVDIDHALKRMRECGIWLSAAVINHARTQASQS